jgi:hypothetical protein
VDIIEMHEKGVEMKKRVGLSLVHLFWHTCSAYLSLDIKMAGDIEKMQLLEDSCS